MQPHPLEVHSTNNAVDTVHPAFCRPAYAIHEKFLALNQDFVVQDEAGQPLLFARRPVGYARSFLALFGAFVTMIVGSALVVTVFIYVDRLRMPVLSGVTLVALMVLLIGAIIGSYVLLNPRWQFDFYADAERTQLLLTVFHARNRKLVLTTYTVSTPSGEVLGQWRKRLYGGLFDQLWIAVNPQAEEVLAARVRGRLAELMGSRSYILRRTNATFHEVHDGQIEREPTATYHRRSGSSGHLESVGESHNHADTRLALALSAVFFATRT